ncbi:MAG: hypothetical protein L6420_11520 [Elusimicrobia bacterium]|nr:hypothetical protein [Elusimicrobiota bacterium]
MEHSEKTKKKALLIFGLLFLAFGGVASVFFISGGIEDLKSFDKKSDFRYGFNFRQAALPFFEYLGFTDGEDARDKSGIRVVSEEEFKELQNAASAGANAKPFASSRIKGGDFKYRRPNIPKLSSKNRGLKSGKAANSKSSLSKPSLPKSKFSKSDVKKDVNITETGSVSKGKARGDKAYGAMRKTENFLAQTHRTNSAHEARSKWDESFIGGGAAKGKMSYKGKGVELDEIKPSVLNLKEGNDRTLDIPEVGAPEKDAAATAKDPAIEKLMEKLKDAANPMDGLVNQMFSSTADAAGKSIGNGEDAPKISQKAVDYAKDNEYIIPGESGKLTVIGCDTDKTFCDENKINGSYYKVSYDGVEGWPPVNLVFVQEESGMRDILPE